MDLLKKAIQSLTIEECYELLNQGYEFLVKRNQILVRRVK